MCFRGGGVVAGAEDAWPAGGGGAECRGARARPGRSTRRRGLRARPTSGDTVGVGAAAWWVWTRRHGGGGRAAPAWWAWGGGAVSERERERRNTSVMENLFSVTLGALTTTRQILF
jgi:hypothetical protein